MPLSWRYVMLNRIDKDETEFMDLKTGTWKLYAYLPPPDVDRPQYGIVGPTERYSQMEHPFARIMFGDTPLFDDYYRKHPEIREIDERNRMLSQKSGLRHVNEDPINEMLALSPFARMMAMGSSKTLYDNMRDAFKLIPTARVPLPELEPDPEQITKKIKAFGLHLGAGKIRIAELKESWVYADQPVPCYGEGDNRKPFPYVICIAVPQNPFFIDNHNGLSQSLEVAWTYAYASFISYVLSDFIKYLGYQAIPVPVSATPYLVPPLFIDCGIGEDSRCGQVVTKEFGNNWRPGGVITNLPLALDKPVDFGLQDFCDKCSICADKCPSGAIPKGGRQVVRGYRKWHVDADKCYTLWCAQGHPCSICQSVCPWNHANTAVHNVIREAAQRSPILRKVLVKGDTVVYGYKSRPEPRWLAESVRFKLKNQIR
jgi:hypothetical protein